MVFGSETWALKKAHMELLSVAQLKMERIMLGITLRDHKHNTWIRHQTGYKWHYRRYQEGNTWMCGTHCTIQRQQMDKKSDRVDTTRIDKAPGKTYNKTIRQPYPPPGAVDYSWVGHNTLWPVLTPMIEHTAITSYSWARKLCVISLGPS